MNVAAGSVQIHSLGRICVSGGISNEGCVPHARSLNSHARRNVYDAVNQVCSWWHPNDFDLGYRGCDALREGNNIISHTRTVSAIGANGQRIRGCAKRRADVFKIDEIDAVVGSDVVAVHLEADKIALVDRQIFQPYLIIEIPL